MKEKDEEEEEKTHISTDGTRDAVATHEILDAGFVDALMVKVDLFEEVGPMFVALDGLTRELSILIRRQIDGEGGVRTRLQGRDLLHPKLEAAGRGKHVAGRSEREDNGQEEEEARQ